ncbi:hypothetical protein [Azospirillum sp. TSA6c]|uniref:hypothetical protein n=1 Tax=Azospirillum sp. TSA6c TaxID=709813 RepID=UPI0011B4F1BB|nr:hypothetical protein [Azospirillum sp. TSA6c]
MMSIAMQDRIIVNIGSASIAAEPVVGRPHELALFVVDADERPAGRLKLGVDRDVAVNIIEAAKGVIANSVEHALGWLSAEVATEYREQPPLAA